MLFKFANLDAEVHGKATVGRDLVRPPHIDEKHLVRSGQKLIELGSSKCFRLCWSTALCECSSCRQQCNQNEFTHVCFLSRRESLIRSGYPAAFPRLKSVRIVGFQPLCWARRTPACWWR